MQDQLVEAIHTSEQNDETFRPDQLALAHDGFYSDHSLQAPYQRSESDKAHGNHLTWLSK